MIVRLLLGAGLFAAGYYLGREVGRTESVRDELSNARSHADDAEPASGPAPEAETSVQRELH